jgi:flagellar motor component MotA
MEAFKNLESNVKNLKLAIARESEIRVEQEVHKNDLMAKVVDLQNKNDVACALIEELEDANRSLDSELNAKTAQLESYKRIEKEVSFIKNGLEMEIETRRMYEESNKKLESEIKELQQDKMHLERQVEAFSRVQNEIVRMKGRNITKRNSYPLR